MIVDFFLVFLSFSDVFFLRVLVLGSSFDLLLFGFLTVLTFRDEFVMLCYLSLRLIEHRGGDKKPTGLWSVS